jgi:hypothetical protein
VHFGHGKLRATDREQQQTVFVTTVRLLGYWRLELPETDPDEWYRDQLLQWPDVTLLVDPNWREDERRRVGEYLQRGTRVNQARGLSLCRFCERHNGSAELTDGVYCWPEGLAHYVSEHDVRLPEEFVGHALSQPPFPPGLPQPSFDELGQRDRSWPGPSFAHLLWAPERPSPYGLSDGFPVIRHWAAPIQAEYDRVDPSWWRQVTGMQGNA